MVLFKAITDEMICYNWEEKKQIPPVPYPSLFSSFPASLSCCNRKERNSPFSFCSFLPFWKMGNFSAVVYTLIICPMWMTGCWKPLAYFSLLCVLFQMLQNMPCCSWIFIRVFAQMGHWTDYLTHPHHWPYSVEWNWTLVHGALLFRVLKARFWLEWM